MQTKKKTRNWLPLSRPNKYHKKFVFRLRLNKDTALLERSRNSFATKNTKNTPKWRKQNAVQTTQICVLTSSCSKFEQTCYPRRKSQHKLFSSLPRTHRRWGEESRRLCQRYHHLPLPDRIRLHWEIVYDCTLQRPRRRGNNNESVIDGNCRERERMTAQS